MNKRCALFPLLFLLACATPSPVKIEIVTMVPPRHPETARYRAIAVMPFDGPGVEETADLIGKALSKVTVNGRNTFFVQDYRKLKDISEEYYIWMMSPPLNTDTYSKIGQLLGVKAVYAGEVTKASADSTYDRSRSTECEQYDHVKKKCIKEKKIVTRCEGREGQLVLNVKLIDVLLSTVVYSGTFSGASNSEDCFNDDVTGEPKRQRITEEVLYHVGDILFSSLFSDDSKAEKTELEMAHLRAVNSLVEAVSPHYFPIQIELMDPGKGITSKEARAKMSAGLDAARLKQVETSCVLFAEAGTLQPDAPSLLFNLGVCEEVKGHLKEAQAQYRRAGMLFGTSNRWIDAALNRIEKRIFDKETLSRLGY
jgi:hypothetical protein